MYYNLITLFGDDQKLKDSIYQFHSGVAQEDKQIPIPYLQNVINTRQQHNSINYSILNTPKTTEKDELISLWNNMISISKLKNFDTFVIVYCFTDKQKDIFKFLNDLHSQMGCQIDQQDILLLTQYQTLIDQVDNLQKNINNLTIILIDRSQQDIFSKHKKNRQFKLSNFTPTIQSEKKLKEIAYDICKIILSKWKEIIENSKNQADFINHIFLKQQISQLLEQLHIESQSQVQIFNLIVNIRQILEERRKDFIDFLKRKCLPNSEFRYCLNQNCRWLYYLNSSKKLEQLYQIEFSLDRPSNSQNYCPKCQDKTYYISFSLMIDTVFSEFQFRINNEITQTQQQKDSKEILQIMFLSNEDEQKTTIFNIIQENYSTYKPKQRNQFFQSSIIKDKYRLHNPPPFDFTQDSENTITTFRDYFCENEIDFFFILVKFERTDIMIQRITNIVKKIHRLDKKRMALIVNQCKNEQEQIVELETSLAIFKFKTIMYFSNQSPQDICKTLFQPLEKVEKQRFDFTDTIFEQENYGSDQKKIKDNLIKVTRQIDEDQRNNFRRQLDSDKEYQEKLEMEIRMLEETLYQKKKQLRELSYKNKQDSLKLNAWEKQVITQF